MKQKYLAALLCVITTIAAFAAGRSSSTLGLSSEDRQAIVTILREWSYVSALHRDLCLAAGAPEAARYFRGRSESCEEAASLIESWVALQ